MLRGGEVVHRATPDLDLPDGCRAVGVRLECGLAGEITDWSGTLTVDGGEVLRTP